MRPETEKIIKEFGIKTFLNEKNIKRAEEQLRNDEFELKKKQILGL